MENKEGQTVFNRGGPDIKPEIKSRKGVPLNELLKREGVEIDKSTSDLLRIMLEQNTFLSHVEIVFISPEEEPNTGGFFHRVEVDEDTFVPTISIVSEQAEHMQKLMETRRSSAERVADMLGIEFKDMTPNLLRQFIITHELGHAVDYVRNYETNPDYQGADAAEEWDLHYEANLLTMPVSGMDPTDLRKEVSEFDNLSGFLEVHPAVVKTINTGEIKTLQDLLDFQELAYRSSEYESYADNFATDFLKRNARELND